MDNLDCAKAYVEDALNNYDDLSKKQILSCLTSALTFLNSVIAKEHSVEADAKQSCIHDYVQIPAYSCTKCGKVRR